MKSKRGRKDSGDTKIKIKEEDGWVDAELIVVLFVGAFLCSFGPEPSEAHTLALVRECKGKEKERERDQDRKVGLSARSDLVQAST